METVLTNFKFKSDLIMAAQFILLTLTAASMISIANLPYQLIFLIQCAFFVMAEHKTYK